MSVDSKNEEAEDEIEVRPRTVAGCISCITCILAVAMVVGHYVVDVNMILLADGDASFEATPSCDQRLGANYSFTLESELKYMVEHPRTFNSPTQVRFQWRSTVRSMKLISVLDLATFSVIILFAVGVILKFVCDEHLEGCCADCWAHTGRLLLACCLGCLVIVSFATFIVLLAVFTSDLLTIKEACEGNAAFDEALLLMRLMWGCVGLPVLLGCVAGYLQIVDTIDYFCGQSEYEFEDSEAQLDVEELYMDDPDDEVLADVQQLEELADEYRTGHHHHQIHPDEDEASTMPAAADLSRTITSMLPEEHQRNIQNLLGDWGKQQQPRGVPSVALAQP